MNKEEVESIVKIVESSYIDFQDQISNFEWNIQTVLESMFEEDFRDINLVYIVNVAKGIAEWLEYDLFIPQHHEINIRAFTETTGFFYTGFSENGEYKFHYHPRTNLGGL